MEDITRSNFESIINSNNKYFKNFLFGDSIKSAISEPFLVINKYLKNKDDKFLDIIFEDCIFDIPVRFTGLKIVGYPYFLKNCTFNKYVYFGNINFEKLCFEYVVFNSECSFYSCEFDDGLLFVETIFNGILSINVSSQKKTTYITNAFFRCNFNSKTIFKSVSFDILDLSYSSIGENIFVFDNCYFNKLALFRKLDLKSNVEFLNSDLSNCSFLNSNFEDVMFSSPIIEPRNHIDYKFYKKIKFDDFKNVGVMNIDEIIAEGTFNNLIDEYRSFEKNFDKKKNYDLAGEFHELSFDIKKDFSKKGFKKFIFWLYKSICDYGENYTKPALLFFIMLFFFPIIYLLSGLDYINNNVHTIIYYFKSSNIHSFCNDFSLGFLYSLVNSFPVKREIEMIKSANGFTVFFASLQTVIQSILIALFIIALKRKFRR